MARALWRDRLAQALRLGFAPPLCRRTLKLSPASSAQPISPPHRLGRLALERPRALAGVVTFEDVDPESSAALGGFRPGLGFREIRELA